MQSEESEKGDSKESELCMVCGKGEDDDDTVETWVLCEQCNNLMHEKCIPVDHVYDHCDQQFICHCCL